MSTTVPIDFLDTSVLETMANSPTSERSPRSEPANPVTPSQETSCAQQQQGTTATLAEQTLTTTVFPDGLTQPETDTCRPSKIHIGWEATSVAMARCDFCQLSSRGVVQKCSICKLSICQQCFDQGRLTNNLSHEIGPGDVSWEPIVTPTASKKTTSKGRRSRIAARRASRGRASGVSNSRNSRKLAHVLLEDTTEGTSSLLPEHGGRNHDQYRIRDRALVHATFTPGKASPKSHSPDQHMTKASTAPYLDQLPCHYRYQDDNSGSLPPMRLVASPSPRCSALPGREESLPSPAVPLSSSIKHNFATGNRLREVPTDDLGLEPTSLPPILPRLSDVHNVGQSRESADSGRPYNRYLFNHQPVCHSAVGQSEYSYQEQPFVDYRHNMRVHTSPEPHRVYAQHVQSYSSCSSPKGQSSMTVLPRSRHGTLVLHQRQAPERSGRSDGSPKNRPLPVERSGCSSGDQWPRHNELRGLASYLMDGAMLTRRRHTEWPPLDWCLKEEISVEWSEGKLRRIFQDDGEAYRFLLGATYIASVNLQLDSARNAARDWLCDVERALCEQGRPPIQQLPTECFLPMD